MAQMCKYTATLKIIYLDSFSYSKYGRPITYFVINGAITATQKFEFNNINIKKSYIPGRPQIQRFSLSLFNS